MKLSDDDKVQLDKFTKYLAMKSTQIIVKSRLGEKVSESCKLHNDGTDWFNLNVPDHPEVLARVKEALNGEVLTSRLPLCVEISLETAEGDKMALEMWCLSVLPEQCDPALRIIHSVYNRMGILLKSLVSVTRVTPAYKLSKRQGPDSYVFCYRVYVDQPPTHLLGDGFKQVRIGQICTPIGTLQFSVSYRTKMTISPTHTGKDNSIMLKSDHFNTNLSPRSVRYKNEEKNSSLSNTMKIGAFADCKRRSVEAELSLPNIPFSKLFIEKLSPDKHSDLGDRNGNSPLSDCDRVKEEDKSKEKDKDKEKAGPGLTMVSTNDDFIMVDLKTPFASTNANTELGKIYREWQTAPPLLEFSEVPPFEEPDLTKQLESFESNLSEYETIVQSLCQSPNNN